MKSLGVLKKMGTRSGAVVQYSLDLESGEVPLNPFIGQKVRLEFTGDIVCQGCGRPTPKSFGQGYCFRCFRNLARCDMCILKPELCHYHQGTCREPDWGRSHCMIPHTVYLANSSGLKVGITRTHQKETRWMDQGAVQAIPLGTVASRLESGLAEVALKKHIADRTDWRALLKGEAKPLDMAGLRAKFLKFWPAQVPQENAPEPNTTQFSYPVLSYPNKVAALNLDKTPEIQGALHGIKGQYWILDAGVLNIRKFTGYRVRFSAD